MISKFDKNGIRERFKKRFAECEEACDYEGAIDFLLKFAAERDTPDFHLACGTLYLQMTQDSDDTELYSMAYREFMMHIRRFPDCSAAYRNLLAVLFLRGDYEAALDFCTFIKRRGLDLRGILTELAEVGLLFISADAPANIDDLLKPGDYGEIDMLPAEKHVRKLSYAELSDPEPIENELGERDADADDPVADRLNGKACSDRRSRVIKFSGKYEGKPSRHVCGAAGGTLADAFERVTARLGSIRSDEPDDDEYYDDYDEYDDFDDEERNEFLDGFHRMIIDEIVDSATDDYRDEDYEGRSSAEYEPHETRHIPEITLNKSLPQGNESDRAVRAAMLYYDAKLYDRAIAELDRIDPDSSQYYFALTVRALIEAETGDDAKAEDTLCRAVSLYPERAFANILLCEFYEKHGRFEKIPPLLKQTDVKDYLNSEYVYKAFRLARRYCDPTDACKLISDYIEEYNIYGIRIVYAQMLYNMGEKSRAKEELYALSRVFYDDLSAGYFYFLARIGVEKMPMEDEVPQSVISSLVENLLNKAATGKLDADDAKDELFMYSLEFFVTLEFENDARLLKDMFNALRFFTHCEHTAEKMQDTLVAPYAEQIVKAVIFAELLAEDPSRKFLAENMDRPVSNETVYVPKGYPKGFYRAFAFVLFTLGRGLDILTEAADELYSRKRSEASELDEAYYLMRRVSEALGEPLDPRSAIALGFPSKAAATRAYTKLCKKT